MIVGQAPSSDAPDARPFTGRSGRRLAALLDVEHECLPVLFDLVNLLDRWPGKAGKGDAFPMAEAKARAARLLPTFLARPWILIVGKATARAFRLRNPKYLEWVSFSGTSVAVVPHPSGVNRWWNDPANVARAEVFMRSLPSGPYKTAPHPSGRAR